VDLIHRLLRFLYRPHESSQPVTVSDDEPAIADLIDAPLGLRLQARGVGIHVSLIVQLAGQHCGQVDGFTFAGFKDPKTVEYAVLVLALGSGGHFQSDPSVAVQILGSILLGERDTFPGLSNDVNVTHLLAFYGDPDDSLARFLPMGFV
jgi:hypothetical protein